MRWPPVAGCGPAILLDKLNNAGEVPGWHGEIFDLVLIPRERTWPLVLAWRLAAENVRTTITRAAPWAVDVSGRGGAAKGIRSPIKINSFVRG